MRKAFSVIFLLLFAVAIRAQTTIQYQTLSPTVSGLGGTTVYSGSNPDSVMTVCISTGKIAGSPVYYATEYSQGSDGQLSPVNNYQQSITVLNAYKSAYNFQQGSSLGAMFHYSVTVPCTATGNTLIATTPANTNFIVAGVIVTGDNDTAGYSANAAISVGTNSTSYNNMVSTVAPSLGLPQVAAASIVSPRSIITGASAIYAKVNTAAVATTETCKIDVYGYFE